ncbi:MAG: hypothetical protein DELT_00999 [Desulfovibrio sp.]
MEIISRKKHDLSTVTLHINEKIFSIEHDMKKENEETTPYNSENNLAIQLTKQKTKTEYTSIQRRDIFLWMASASESVLCEAMKSINPSPYKKLMGPDKARLHALLVAADQVRSTLERTGRKNPDRALELVEETHALHLDMLCRSKRRRSPKREKIALHAGVVSQLFARGLSLRQVCAYLKRHAGLDVNHSYLRQCCLDMEIPISTREGAHEKNI